VRWSAFDPAMACHVVIPKPGVAPSRTWESVGSIAHVGVWVPLCVVPWLHFIQLRAESSSILMRVPP